MAWVVDPDSSIQTYLQPVAVSGSMTKWQPDSQAATGDRSRLNF